MIINNVHIFVNVNLNLQNMLFHIYDFHGPPVDPLYGHLEV
jgi:hypothetical protein